MSTGINLLLVVFFLAMNAFFVIAEFTLVRVRHSQIEVAVEEGKPGAENALIIADNVNAYLSACQLGITVASLALGWLGEPAIAVLFYPLFEMLGFDEATVYGVSLAIGFCLVTALQVVVGELIPKSLAIFNTERWALATATPLLWFYRITYPIMWLFNSITNGVVRMLGHDPSSDREVYTEEEIRTLIDESTENGLIGEEQNEYVDNIFDIADKDASAIMTPRTEMICLSLEDTLQENLAIAEGHKFTRYPVFRKDKDDIVGFVHIKDLYTLSDDMSMDDVRIRSIAAVPEGLPVVKLLKMLKAERTKIAIVVDEHGGTSGMVTMGDVFEQIVGDYEDEYFHGDDDKITRIGPGHFLTNGSCPIDDFNEALGIQTEEEPPYETLGGLLLELFDRIPRQGDRVQFVRDGKEVRFLVTSMDQRRIDDVEFWVRKLEEPEGTDAAAHRADSAQAKK
jgi:CBS domain containing-hemolysin-like protein